MSIGRLIVELIANTGEFETDMGRAARVAEREAKRMNKEMIATAKQVGAALAAVATGFAYAANRAIQFGDDLNKAAIKAGIAGGVMSELAYVAKHSDLSIDDLSTALRFMQKTLVGASEESKEQAKALEKLGLTAAQLRAMKPEEAFELLADRIAAIEDPAERAVRTLAVFGKAGANLLPTFEQGAAGIRKLREEARELGIAFSDDQIRRLADADTAIKKLTASWQKFVGVSAIGAVAVAEAFGIMDPQELEVLNEEFSKLQKRRAEIVESLANVSGKGFTKGFIEEQTNQLNRNLATVEARMSAINDQMRQIGISSGNQPKTATPATPAASASLFKNPIDPQLMLELERSFAEVEEMARASAKRVEATFTASGDVLAQLNAHATELVGESINESIRLNEEAVESMMEATSKAENEMSEFGRSAAQNVQSAFADFLFDPFEDGLRGMAKGFIDIIRRMIAEAASAKILESLFKSSGGLGGAFGSALSSLFGGARAGGGPVMGGKAYLVGERGPELFIPNSAGSVLANATGGGGVTIVQNNDMRGATSDFIRAFPELMRRNNEALKADLLQGLSNGTYRAS